MKNDRSISLNAAIDAVHKNYDTILDFKSDGKTVAYSIEDILSGLPSAQPEWIPCSERLPEHYGNYLVTYKTDDIEPDIATYNPDRVGVWSACDADGFYWVASKGLEVVAWMPLPNTYIEEK